MYDKYFMTMALALAAKGEGFTSPNPMVGAVVVKDGKVVGRGYHEALGAPHAEVNAIDDAGDAAQGATLYVNLEPCNHSGRTPPCTEKILNASIKRVVVGMEDPNPDVKGGGIDYLRKKGIHITLGVCEEEAKKLNERFIKYIQTKRPFVILKCAATMDGRIATKTGDSKWITGPESRHFAHRLRHAADAIMVGINTVKRDNPSLTTRLDSIKGIDPVRIILDPELSIPEDAQVLQLDSDAGTLIITGDSVSTDKKIRIEKKGARVVELAQKDGFIDLDQLMNRLGAMDITSLLIEGGSQVIASAFSAGIVDKIFFFYAPRILGGNDGVPICTGTGPDKISNAITVKNIKTRRFSDDVLIEGYLD